MPVITGGEVYAGLRRGNVFVGSGVPTVNVTGLGSLVVGDMYVNSATGVVYVVTATNGTSTITFTVVGTQV